jgi:hypothetical protein
MMEARGDGAVLLHRIELSRQPRGLLSSCACWRRGAT